MTRFDRTDVLPGKKPIVEGKSLLDASQIEKNTAPHANIVAIWCVLGREYESDL